MLFDPTLRDAGDAEWMVRLLRQKIPMAVLRQFTSTFAFTGSNMSVGINATRERRELFERAPAWARWFRPAIVVHHRLRRLASGMYSQSPFTYEVFTLTDPEQRRTQKVERPRAGWPS